MARHPGRRVPEVDERALARRELAGLCNQSTAAYVGTPGLRAYDRGHIHPKLMFSASQTWKSPVVTPPAGARGRP